MTQEEARDLTLLICELFPYLKPAAATQICEAIVDLDEATVRKAVKEQRRTRNFFDLSPLLKACRPVERVMREEVEETEDQLKVRRQQPLRPSRSYRAYIGSVEWRERAAALIKERNFYCQKCGRRECLGVHHITYERLGHERDEDLLVLCVECHASFHAKRLVRHGNVACVMRCFFLGPGPITEKSPYVELYVIAGVVFRKHVVRIRVRLSGIDEEGDGLPVAVRTVDFFNERERAAIADFGDPSSASPEIPASVLDELRIWLEYRQDALTHLASQLPLAEPSTSAAETIFGDDDDVSDSNETEETQPAESREGQGQV